MVSCLLVSTTLTPLVCCEHCEGFRGVLALLGQNETEGIQDQETQDSGTL